MAGIAKRATVEIPINVNGMEKLEKLNSALNRMTRRNSAFKNSFIDTSKRLGEFNDKAKEFGTSYSRLMEKSINSNREFNKVSKESSKQIAQDQKDIQKSLNQTKNAQKNLSNSSAGYNKTLGNSHNSVGKSIDSNTSKLERMNKSGKRMISQGTNLSMTFAGLGVGIFKGGKNALDLQNEYIKVQNLAINGGEKQRAVQKNMNAIQKQGSNLAQRYGVSQNSISKGYEALVRRGYTTNEALGSQNSLLKASIASGDDYQDVVNNAGDAIDQFGLRTNNASKMAQNTKTATNQMAYAADLTATNFQGMGYALKYVGATAHTAHQSMADTSAAIGTLSNSGQDASVAGTGLRQVLNSLISPETSKVKMGALSQIGLDPKQLRDSKGNLKSLDDVFKILNDKTQNMTGTQRGDVFHRLFGATGQESASILSSNQGQLKSLNEQVSKAQNQSGGKGYTSRLSQQNMASTQKQLDRLVQAVNAFAIDIANQMLPTVSKMAGGLSNFIGWLNKLSPMAKKFIGWGTVFTVALGPIELFIGGFKRSIATLLGAFGKLRRQMSIPMPSNATNSISEQAMQNNVIGPNIGNSSPNTGGSSLGSTGSRLGRTEKSAGNASRLGRTTSNVSRETGNVTKISKLSRLGSGLSKIGDLTAVISTAIPLLSTLNGKNTGSKTANATATGLSSFIPYIGPFVAPIIGNIAGKAFNDKDLDDQNKKLRQQMHVSHNRPQTPKQRQLNRNSGSRNDIAQEFTHAQDLNEQANNSYYSKTRKHLLKQNRNTYAQMEAQLTAYNDKEKRQTDKSTNYLLKHHYISNKDLLKGNQGTRDKNVKAAQKALQKLSKAESKGGRTREKARKKAEKAIAKATSNSSSQQKIILGKLRDSTAKISDKQAGKQIRASYKSMKKTVGNAKKDYTHTRSIANQKRNKLINYADNEYYAHHKISKKKYNDLVGRARKERNQTVDKARAQKNGTVWQAEDQHSKVVKAAKKQSKEHLSTLDSETGQAKGKWTWLSEQLGKIFKGMFNKFVKFFEHPIQNSAKGIAGWINKNTSGVGDTSKSHQSLLKQAGIPKGQWGAYNDVISQESSWNKNASNSGHTGLGQLSGANRKKLDNGDYGDPNTEVAQLKAMHDYMKDRYNNNATNAVRHEATNQWYGNGGWSHKPSIFGEVSGQPEVAINPRRDSADNLISQAINARAKANASSKWAKISKSQANNRKTGNLQSNISNMMNKQGTSKSSQPIQITQNINISGNADKGTTRRIGQQTKEAIKQVMDEYFNNKNDAIFNS